MNRSAVVALGVTAVVLVAATVPTTGADLADAAAASVRVEALPTLWWAVGDDTHGQHGDGSAGPGTSAHSRVSWRPAVSMPKGMPVERVSVGDGSACGIAGGRVHCWGDNSHGQLGDGTTVSSADPVAVAVQPAAGSVLPADAVVTDVSVGAGAACAVADGNVYCWGDNSAGRLGNDSLSSSLVPVAVATDGLGGSAMPSGTATQVATGGGGPGSTTSFTCAVAAARAYCWGSRENGRLGNGVASATPRRTPVAVNSGSWGASGAVSRISLGEAVACAVAEGLVHCWGRASFGQLGNGLSAPGVEQTIPLAVETAPSSALPGSALVSDVAVGATSACAIHDGTPYCWGTNLSGQLGADLAVDTEPTSTVVRRATAVARLGTGASELPLDARATSIAAGGRLSGPSTWCTLANRPAAGAVPYCWGGGSSGQLGLGTTGDQLVPRAPLLHPSSQLPVGVDIAGIAPGEGVVILVARS